MGSMSVHPEVRIIRGEMFIKVLATKSEKCHATVFHHTHLLGMLSHINSLATHML